VVLDEEARHHQVKFAFELFAKKKLLSSIPFFLLVQFLHQNDALAPFHRTSLSLSLCNATMTSAFKNLPALLHHIEVVAISLLGIPFHAL
jgi:hypothetical protein